MMAETEGFVHRHYYSVTAAGLQRHVYCGNSGGRCKKLALSFYLTPLKKGLFNNLMSTCHPSCTEFWAAGPCQ